MEIKHEIDWKNFVILKKVLSYEEWIKIVSIKNKYLKIFLKIKNKYLKIFLKIKNKFLKN